MGGKGGEGNKCDRFPPLPVVVVVRPTGIDMVSHRGKRVCDGRKIYSNCLSNHSGQNLEYSA